MESEDADETLNDNHVQTESDTSTILIDITPVMKHAGRETPSTNSPNTKLMEEFFMTASVMMDKSQFEGGDSGSRFGKGSTSNGVSSDTERVWGANINDKKCEGETAEDPESKGRVCIDLDQPVADSDVLRGTHPKRRSHEDTEDKTLEYSSSITPEMFEVW